MVVAVTVEVVNTPDEVVDRDSTGVTVEVDVWLVEEESIERVVEEVWTVEEVGVKAAGAVVDVLVGREDEESTR